MFDEQYWEERYRSADTVWSGRPNPQLVAEAADLPAGTALDVGCGEGADACWLASRGWRVTAVDHAATALQRGAAHAETLGAEVAGRIRWVRADIITADFTAAEFTAAQPSAAQPSAGPSAAGAFDLVSAQYMHPRPEERAALFARMADAVAPGGTLLVVGHHVHDLDTAPAHRPPMPDLFYTAGQVADVLDPDRWDVLVSAARPRTATDADGNPMAIHDSVLRARRRPLASTRRTA